MIEEKKLDTIGKDPTTQGKQVFLSKDTRVGDNPNKMVIGSGTSFKGSDINTDSIEIYGKVETSVNAKIIFVGSSAEIIGSVTCEQIEIHGSVSGAIQTSGKVIIKKSATVVGTLRYQAVSIEEGASIFSDLHCTNADQKLLDKISKLRKQMNPISMQTANPLKETKKGANGEDLKEENQETEIKKKRYFFK